MKKLLEFLSEDNGRLSNTRLANFLVVLSFITDWQAHIWRHIEYNPSFTIVGIVASIMGIKVAQKFAEKKNPEKR